MNQVTPIKQQHRHARISEIRDLALARLQAPDSGFDVSAHQSELAALAPGKRDRNAPDYLEANILLVLCRGARPRRAQKSLYRLYKARIARSEIPQFESFKQRLKEAEKQGVSLKGLSFPQSFWSMDHGEIWADIDAVLGRISLVLGDVFLNSGTLLGAVRDRSLIAHDDDVDLAVVLKADSAEAAGREWKKIFDTLKKNDLLAGKQGRNPIVYKLKSGGFYNIDLFPAWIEKGRVFVYPHTFGELEEGDLYPLKECPTTGLPIPQNPQAMLAANYGEGWRVPDPVFEFPWNRANLRFAALREAMDTADDETTDSGSMDVSDPSTMKRWQRRARISEIREIAANQLKSHDDGFDITPYLEELWAMETKPRAYEDLEARIMFYLRARAKPTRVRRLIRMLRERREKDGEPHLFDEFETFLKGLLKTDTLIGHDFSPETFASLDHHVVWDDVGSAIATLEGLTKGAFLNSGTLLGVTRDKRLIDHDDDVDLAVLLDADTHEGAAEEWARLRGELKARGVLDEENMMSPEIFKIRSSGPYFVDVFPAWVVDGRVHVYPHTFGELAEDEVFPLKTCKVTGHPIPAEPEKMLALNYGENWQTPDPYFKFPWNKAKPRFKAFRDAAAGHEARRRGGTIITYGTFDLFHVGHVRLLRRLAALGDRLVVGCSTDEFNAIKGKTCVMSYEDRMEILRSCSYVDEVFPEDGWDQKRDDIKRFGASVFAMGDDWKGEFDDLADLCEVLYLPRTENVSTTDLKKRVHKQNLDKARAAAE